MDSFAANKRYAEDLTVTFPLLSDWHRKVVKDYGLLDEKSGYSRRATFVIDKEGKGSFKSLVTKHYLKLLVPALLLLVSRK